MDLFNLLFEVPRHQRLAEEIYTMHSRFDATSAVVSTPASLQSATQVSLRTDRIVSGTSSGARRFPGLGIRARRDPCMGVSGGNRLVAFTRVIRPICGYAADVLIGRNLVQEFGQHGSVSDVAAGGLDRPNFQSLLIDPNVYLAPDAPFGATMLTGIPFAFSFGFNTGAVDKEVQRTLGSAIRQAHVQCSLAAT